jgi:hypothetical protein
LSFDSCRDIEVGDFCFEFAELLEELRYSVVIVSCIVLVCTVARCNKSGCQSNTPSTVTQTRDNIKEFLKDDKSGSITVLLKLF